MSLCCAIALQIALRPTPKHEHTTGPVSAADAPKPKVGDPFPDVAVKATQAELVKKDAKEISIKDLKGKIVVVAFYPKALTGG